MHDSAVVPRHGDPLVIKTPDASSIHISVFAFALRSTEGSGVTKKSQLGYHLPEVLYGFKQAERIQLMCSSMRASDS